MDGTVEARVGRGGGRGGELVVWGGGGRTTPSKTCWVASWMKEWDKFDISRSQEVAEAYKGIEIKFRATFTHKTFIDVFPRGHLKNRLGTKGA